MKKTYTKTAITEEPRLVISYDECASSPREWSNLGYFITVDRNYNSPDKYETLEAIVKLTGDEADNLEEHIKFIKRDIKEELGEKVLFIRPVCKYEHSGVSYSLGTAHGFDYSNNGFYIITDKSIKECGTAKKDWERLVEGEIDIYNKYVNGEVYRFELFDKNGNHEDSCCGFYSIEEIRDHLPQEWSKVDLDEYFIN